MTFCFLDARLPCQVYWDLKKNGKEKKESCIIKLQKSGFAAGVGRCWFDNTMPMHLFMSGSICVGLSMCVLSMWQVCEEGAPLSTHSLVLSYVWVTARATFEIIFIGLFKCTLFFPLILQISYFKWLKKPRSVLLDFLFPSPQFFSCWNLPITFKTYIGLFCSTGDIIKALNPLMREMCTAWRLLQY